MAYSEPYYLDPDSHRDGSKVTPLETHAHHNPVFNQHMTEETGSTVSQFQMNNVAEPLEHTYFKVDGKNTPVHRPAGCPATPQNISTVTAANTRNLNHTTEILQGMSKTTCVCFIGVYMCCILALSSTAYAIYKIQTSISDVDACGSSPCMNNGQCFDGVNQFRCLCAPGWEGDRCQNNVDDCGSSPCINNGQCIDGVNRFRCICAPGWEGDRCQTSTQTEQTLTGASSFTRWGRSDCTNTSELIYKGYAAGSHWTSDGNGANYLCLHEEPEYDQTEAVLNTDRASINGVEIRTSDFPPLSSSHLHDMVCAVCRAATRGAMVMIPAKVTCPSGWTREYYGYLMSNRRDYKRTEYICVDRNPTIVSGTHERESGSVIYPVEVRCFEPDPNVYSGGLPCDKFPKGNELSCVICTK